MSEDYLCRAELLKPSEPLKVTLDNGLDIALYVLDGEYYATDDLCTHGEASLSDGEIKDGRIICPYHMGSFCIRTGEPIDMPCTVPVNTYRVVERDGKLYVTRDDLK